ncbi:MAG: nucleoside monophosphate kinase [Planctomycetota bacterium]
MDRHEAILLIGPTGSGKTPLGDLLEERGLRDRPCAHFDFGRELRRMARESDSLFDADEVAFIREVLEEGALLENEHFHVAEKILAAFLAGRLAPRAAVRDPRPALVVLNGLPRHIGQAANVDRIVDIRAVIHLNCTPEVVLERIRTNAGGDRARRADDELAAVRRKLALFKERTKPLVEHYAGAGASIAEIEVRAETSPEAVRAALVCR